VNQRDVDLVATPKVIRSAEVIGQALRVSERPQAGDNPLATSRTLLETMLEVPLVDAA
jgi:hypothetical protein